MLPILSIVVVRDLLEPTEMKCGRRRAFVSQETRMKISHVICHVILVMCENRHLNVDCRNKERIAMELRHSVTIHFLLCPPAAYSYLQS